MHVLSRPDRPLRRIASAASMALAAATVLLFSAWPDGAQAQRRERSGKEVTDAVCAAACHGTGEKSAPKIGDAAAWRPRAAQGLTSLTAHALTGIRNMPAHGGSPNVSDIEIERAIIHMVNLSGGRWVEPVGGLTPAVLRGSDAVVQLQCAKCHEGGTDGAPKIGDRTAWIPRLKKGLDPLVASAIHGHGGMPARGGLADLSDQEIRGAIIAMFNHGVAIAQPAAPTSVAKPDPYHKAVGGTEVYLGMMSADALRNKASGPAKAAIPAGKDLFHLNISLADSKTNVFVTDAEVTVSVSDGMRIESRPLDLVSEHNAFSYGSYFQLQRGTPYIITAKIKRPGLPAPVEARFDYKVF
ncbi:MAG: cytochrome c5 family protein [Burkholderiales bacterium]|nr:cytochrome c5 family protein [Burkholderiales bacterium]